jgi:hypothetical protein
MKDLYYGSHLYKIKYRKILNSLIIYMDHKVIMVTVKYIR